MGLKGKVGSFILEAFQVRTNMAPRCQGQNQRRPRVMFRATKDGLAGPDVTQQVGAHSEDPDAKQQERVGILGMGSPLGGVSVSKKGHEGTKYGNSTNNCKNKHKQGKLIQGNVPGAYKERFLQSFKEELSWLNLLENFPCCFRVCTA